MTHIDFNFDKPTISKGVLDFLAENLIEDPDTNRDVVKKNLIDSLAIIAKGNKLDYGSANNLLQAVLRSLNLEDSSVEDEIAPANTQSADDSLCSQLPEVSATSPKVGEPVRKISPDKKLKEICKFYARGHCTRNKDCRFDHPKICNKFRQFGSTSNDSEGCDGKCNAFHPNACRRSLKDKTCSFPDCRFFHLKGTRRNPNPNGSSSQNWRSYQDNQNQNQSRPSFESKNRFAGLSKKAQKRGRNPRPGPPKNTHTTPQAPKLQKPETVTQEEKTQLGQTLEAILKRLAAMETKQASYPQLHQPVQPQMFPAVPQPGTKTQFQWASQPPWLPTQTQSQF